MSGWWNLFSEPWVPRLGWVLIHFLWQGTALALLLAVALRILARASAHVRYLVIGGALLLCGAMPVATWTMLAPATVLPFAPAPMLPEATSVPVPSGLEAKAMVTMAAEPLGDAGMGWPERLSRGAEAALPYVVGLWFGGVLLLTLRLTLAWTLMQRLCLSGSPIHDVLCRERFQRLLERMRIGVPVRLLESARVEVPTLIGWLRPTILVPTSVFVGLSPEQLEAILAHELAHVRRYDYPVNLFQTVIETILFYHPAVWWISRKLREERENCCDDLALEVMQDRLVYVSALAQLEAGRRMPLVLTASGGSLLQRIRRIVGANDRKVSAWPLWILIMAVLSLVCLSKTKAAGTTAVSTSPAATGKDDAMMIRTGLKVVRIDEDEYQAHRAAIDDAVQRGDMTPLTQLKSFDLLSSPAVLAKAGERGVLEAVRVLPYSAGVAQDPSSNGNPTDYLGNGDYKRQNLGLRFVIFPAFIDGKINLKGDLNLTSLEGWTRISEKTHRPNFHVREAPVSESFVSGQTKGFAMPGGAQMEPADPSVAYFPDKIPDASKNPKALRRIFFFLNEQAFHRDGQTATEQTGAGDEAPFCQSLERDRTLGTDPSVKSSTLAADAQMLLAIQKGDVVALKKVLEHAVDPNTFDPDRFYSCPVYWAVYFNQPEILKLLLEHLATGDLGPARETPLQLAQKSHPDLVPIIQEGLKRNNAVLTARLTEKLHSIHIDLPAFSGAPLPKVTQFLLDATSKAGYLDRRVNIGNMDLPPSTTITSPARPNISIWDALQTIADASKLRFDVDGSWPGCITLYPPRDEAVIHPSAKNAEDPPPAQAPSVTNADLYVSVKVVGINDSEYQAHRDPIDAAIRAGDADALTKFETYRVIDQPGCYVNYGKRMVIATGPRTLPDGSLAGETFLAIDLTPTQAGAQINFKGRVVVDTMAGSTQLSPSVVRPNIDSRQALIALDVAPGTTTALKSPDGPGGDATPEVLSGPYLVQSPDGKTSAVVRLFFFLKASPQA